ncbi:MAG: HAMP domain-containing histidine kinase [Clostridiales bacterium]|nr:HAMP domain-containing histidine kinase [Clostridiales bacterium]
MTHRVKFDHKSLNFKLWAYFAVFALLLMAVLWSLQIFFLNTFYQDMKIRETTKVASTIEKQYGSSDFREIVGDLSATNDVYIYIQTFGGYIFFYPSTEDQVRLSYAYQSEIMMVRAQLFESGEPHVSVIIPAARTNANTLAYATYLGDTPETRVVLYIFSPLYPVSSTVSILGTQLAYITVISLLLAFAISYYLSRRVTRPISAITRSAKSLAEGKYGITFKGGHYTEIIELADTLTYASSRLEKTNTMQKDLMANVSHDLLTPLTMVKSYAEMIKDISGDDPEKRAAHLNVIIEEADRLNLLVSDMLTLSRVQSGTMPFEKSSFNIKSVIESILQSYNIYCENEGFNITLLCSGDVTVVADEAKIKQVILNLLNNALKYCGQDKQVVISLKRSADKVRCEFTDHGMGIPQSEIGHIWDKYYKASTNHVRSTAGTGIGLSIVKEILSLHNAEFGVVSEPGQGSTFWFVL